MDKTIIRLEAPIALSHRVALCNEKWSFALKSTAALHSICFHLLFFSAPAFFFAIEADGNHRSQINPMTCLSAAAPLVAQASKRIMDTLAIASNQVGGGAAL